MALVKTVTRVVVIGGLATGTAVLVAGPQRVSALFTQAHHAITSKIDSVIDDPVALRQQLRELESQYPKRIGDVRGELVDVRDQIAELEREKGISDKVVGLASADLSQLQPLLQEAQTQRAASPMRVITVRFDGRSLPLEDAYTKATQISNTVTAYRQRADQATRNLKFLHDQESRLAELLTKLETERAELQSKLWLLNGEIEMIDRNDKLIDMTQARQNAIEKYERYDAVSLDQVTSRINKIRSEQEAKLQALANHDGQSDYEDRARTMLESEATARTIFEKSKATTPTTTPTAIEIGPEDVQQKTNADADATVASR